MSFYENTALSVINLFRGPWLAGTHFSAVAPLAGTSTIFFWQRHPLAVFMAVSNILNM